MKRKYDSFRKSDIVCYYDSKNRLNGEYITIAPDTVRRQYYLNTLLAPGIESTQVYDITVNNKIAMRKFQNTFKRKRIQPLLDEHFIPVLSRVILHYV